MASRQAAGGIARRRLLTGGAAAFALLATRCTASTTRSRIVRIGAFCGERLPKDGSPPPVQLDIMDGLHGEGFVEGQTMSIDWRHAQGDTPKYAEIANDLAAAGYDLLIASSSRAAVAAKAATRTIPIVMQGVADPREWGVVDDYAHPGGNITGTAFDSTDEARKRVEILHEAFPQIRRIVIVGLFSTTVPTRQEELRRAGDRLGVFVDIAFTESPGDLSRALESAAGSGIVVGGSVSLDIASIIAFATQNRIPAIYARPENVADGGLMSYGGNRKELRVSVGRFVRQIVTGTPPGDIPVWLPKTWDFVFNATVAAKAGFTLPRSVSLRVTDVVP